MKTNTQKLLSSHPAIQTAVVNLRLLVFTHASIRDVIPLKGKYFQQASSRQQNLGVKDGISADKKKA